MVIERDFREPLLDIAQFRWAQTRSRERQAERIHVAPDWHAAEQRRLDGRGAPSHERVIDSVARHSQPLDEKARQLRLETGAIRNLVQTAGRSLFGGPELIHVRWNGYSAACASLSRGLYDLRGFPKLSKSSQLLG